jgi:hypothetical protein
MRLNGRLAALGGLAAFALVLAACAPTSSSSAGPTTPGPGPGIATATGGATTGATPPATEPPPAGDYKVTYDFGVPSSPVKITHTVHPPIGGPSEPPLPYLVGIYVADHPEGSPKYQRISFYFRGAFPSYSFSYVKSVLSDGQGTPIQLTGNAYLRIGFTDAQAHDNGGASTVATKPSNPINFQNLKSYGPAGDFEGHLTYGLGLQMASGSDQALPIRAGELKKPDGSGGFYYVVHFDVQTA